MIKKMLMLTAGCAVVIATTAPISQAQDNKPAPNVIGMLPAPGKLVPLRLQLVISRFNGEKKIASMPHTMWVTANEPSRTQLRMGSDIPVVSTVFGSGEKDKPGSPMRSWNYRPVGTNIDCTASSVADGFYKLVIVLNDSSIQFDPKATGPASAGMADAPVFRNFSSNFVILLRDGQTATYSSATDPVSGEVVKVDVTLNVLK